MRKFRHLFHLAAAATLAAAVASSSPARAATFNDNFPGTTLNPVWTAGTPAPGPTIAVKDGLMITTPSTAIFDYWTGVGNSPNISLPAPSGDFTTSVLVQPSTDPTGAPLEGMNYHAVLFINFGGTDNFFWGIYTSNSHLRLERSGVNNVAETTSITTPVWLQIQKIGTMYHFSYREAATDPWTEVTDANGNPAVQTVTKAPVSLGLMLKTWAMVGGTATFNNFQLDAASLKFPGTLTGKVTTNGPSPAKISVQAVSSLTHLAGPTGAVASDGSYSLTLPPGPYDVSLVGSDLAAAVPSTSVTVAAGGTASANFTAQVLPDLNPATDQVFDDPFTGSTLNPAWLPFFPLAGPTITLKNGLQFTLPDTSPFDYWSTVGNAPQLRLPAPNGDFVEAAKINSINDATGAPLSNINFHTSLMVNFGGSDALMFGAYRSETHLQVERSGQGNLAGVDIPGTPAWVQITKTGNAFTFAYKIKDTDPWTPLAGADGKPYVMQIIQRPLAVGVMQKTWEAVALVSTFGEYRLEAAQLNQYGTISGTVTASGNTATSVTVEALDSQGNLIATSPVAMNGSYQLAVGGGAYTVTATGPEVVTPQAAASRSGITVTGGKTTMANFTVQLYPPLNPATDQVFSDTFANTTIKPEWAPSIPVTGPTITANNGLVFNLPATSAYDYWVGVANAPELTLPAPVGDFTESATFKGNADPTGAPIDAMNYHSALFVNFGGTDTIFWGDYRMNGHLQLERSGTGNIAGVDVAGTPVSVQITNTGGDYTFQYRQKDTDPWTDLVDATGNKVVIHVNTPPGVVGILQKQWAAFASTTTWSNYRLEAGKLKAFGTLTGKVTKAAGDGSVIQIQVLDAAGNILQTIPVNADGSYTATLLAGAYSVRALDDAPSVRASMANVNLAANQPTTVNFDLTQGALPLGDPLNLGKIGIGDATFVLQVVVKLKTPTNAQFIASDVDKDGVVTIKDVTKILQAIVNGTTFK